jgi:hypothetical protein
VFSRQAAAAYFGVGGAMVSTATSLNMVRKLSRELSLAISANYAQNVTAPVDAFKFESITGQAKISYAVTRILDVSLMYDYNYYNYSQPGNTVLPAYSFNRNVVTFALTGTWN